MKTTRRIPFFSLTVLFAFFISVDDLIAEELTTPTLVRQAARKAEGGKAQTMIRWSVLAPENGKPFNDPFAKLTQNQLADLSYVVRVQRLIAENKIKADGVDAKEGAGLARKLTSEGVDIVWLMAQRERVQQIRGLQVDEVSNSIVEFLGYKEVTLTGYVIPITVDHGQVTEFFLVPTVAACSHEAAPPPLQVVYVSTDEGFAAPDKATPVRVTGIIKASNKAKTKISASGKATVRSAYTMVSPAVETYAQAHR